MGTVSLPSLYFRGGVYFIWERKNASQGRINMARLQHLHNSRPGLLCLSPQVESVHHLFTYDVETGNALPTSGQAGTRLQLRVLTSLPLTSVNTLTGLQQPWEFCASTRPFG